MLPSRFMHNFTISFYLFLLSLLFMPASQAQSKKPAQENIIVDANYTLESSLAGLQFPDSIRKTLQLVTVTYYSFDNKLHLGQLVIHKELAKDITAIFEELRKKHFKIEKVIPIVKYGWNDDSSMADNNTSAFNYRVVAHTTRLSNHSWGRAVDINPRLNPQFVKGVPSPPGSTYNSKVEGTITAKSFVVKLFKQRGWRWLGTLTSREDYQHFDKMAR